MLFYNEDWIHFIWTRHKAGIEITEDVLREYIYSFKGTQITDFVMNVNGTVSTANSQVFETFAQKYIKNKQNSFAIEAYKLLEKNIDMYSVWLEALKEIGIRPWISVRMNDCHGNMEQDNIRKSTYVEAHPELHIAAHREKTGYFDKCFNYHCEEIRKRMLIYINEMLGKYDVSGLELDMMRDTFFFQFGTEWHGFEVMNSFMLDVHKIISKYEKQYGHSIKLSIILPSNPNMLIEKGIDLFGFGDKIDFITIISRWETTDTDMPIELWRQLLRNTDIMLGGGQQLLYRPYRAHRYTTSSVKMAFGQAVSNLSRGCDYVYLYNYMDMGEYEGEIRNWIYDNSIRNDANRPLIFNNIGEITTLLKQERSHMVTYSDFSSYYMGVSERLPIFFNESSQYEQVKVPVGKIPENAKISLILGLNQQDKIEASDIEIYANAKKCIFEKIIKPDGHIYETDCFVFDVSLEECNVYFVEMKINKKCALEHIEIKVIPK